ncbi:metalloregulator ArsR/SmtB family transcription factor [Pelagicoccus sp. SDUM812002]|uniref:ArsR/SmtB family transcription factor n=1 Tax=Pelagicoccus sp. SDUM812002 TaxID=3041266 RepID=UPI00280DE78E|nr:metalloregulator ArsR/SmtB family transcription factor [Pelagicoccus sp. SDUM812002]MDQ8184608.1 metalloregulator ArsR/SmtB family transcription factor [Pelagicoccus sp. SDUM812002]
MNCISVYKCLCDETRLRILNLLREGPLCVCHVQEALQLPQSKISKQLAFMKRNGLLQSRRYNNWTVYEIPEERNTLLEENLRCLQDLLFSDAQFKRDRGRLSKIDTSVACVAAEQCCESKID